MATSLPKPLTCAKNSQLSRHVGRQRGRAAVVHRGKPGRATQTDAAERAALITQAEDLEAFSAELEKGRHALQEKLDKSP